MTTHIGQVKLAITLDKAGCSEVEALASSASPGISDAALYTWHVSFSLSIGQWRHVSNVTNSPKAESINYRQSVFGFIKAQ